MNTQQKVWLITGASRGMGLEVTQTVLANGGKVIAISRSLTDTNPAGATAENFLAVKTDITNETEVAAAIGQGIANFGKIDVVLNNAGYYLVGSLEEISDEEFRKTVDVNLFGTVNIIRHVMPHFRQRRSGHIINIASNMGYIGYANTGSYNAAKFAVIGLSEALAQEVKAFGIQVTVVAPGMFRTNFMSPTTLMVAHKQIADYQVAAHVKMLRSFDGQQPGNPQQLARVLYDISIMEQPPLHLPLGTDSYLSIVEQREREALELEQWKHLSLSTDF